MTSGYVLGLPDLLEFPEGGLCLALSGIHVFTGRGHHGSKILEVVLKIGPNPKITYDTKSLKIT